MKRIILLLLVVAALFMPPLSRRTQAYTPPPAKPQHFNKVVQTPVRTAAPAPPEQTSADTPAPEPVQPRQQTTHEARMTAAGIASADQPAADFIFSHESSWDPAAINYLGCIGLGQSCTSGLVSDCPDWQTDMLCQLKHFNDYAARRYGGWWQAYYFWVNNHWW